MGVEKKERKRSNENAAEVGVNCCDKSRDFDHVTNSKENEKEMCINKTRSGWSHD